MEPANAEAKPVAATGQISGAGTVTKSSSAETGKGLTSGKTIIINVDSVDFHYGQAKALHGISLKVPEKLVTAFIGPSGCGKSTLLRCFNRMNDLIDNGRIEGRIQIAGNVIYGGNVDVIELRKRVGMVFQRSNPFPNSIYENIAYALRLQSIRSRSELD